MKNAIIEILDSLIFGMREGREPEDIMQDDNMKKEISNTCMPVMTQENAVETAKHIVDDLYDGKFPVDHLEVGDICIDPFDCNPCIITNINDRTIHVIYFNGKTYKFKKNQERYFKKLNRNVLLYLNKLLEIARNKAESSLRSLNQERPGYDFPIATNKDVIS